VDLLAVVSNTSPNDSRHWLSPEDVEQTADLLETVVLGRM